MPIRGQYLRSYTAFTVTFASGSPTSNAFSLAANGYALGNVVLPSAFTGFALGAQIATAGGSFFTLPDSSGLYGHDVSCILPTAQLDSAIARPMPPYWFGAGQVKLLSHDGTGSGMPQSSARVCTVQVIS